jgi:hypothetical protein
MIPEAIEERAVHEVRLRAPTTEQRHMFRGADCPTGCGGAVDTLDCARSGTMTRTVSGSRGRFAREGLAGLEDVSARGMDDAIASAARARHGPATGHACLAHQAQGTVCKILDADEVKPHEVRYYLEGRDPEFEPKMAEVLCVYRKVKLLKKRKQPSDAVAFVTSTRSRCAGDAPPTEFGREPDVIPAAKSAVDVMMPFEAPAQIGFRIGAAASKFRSTRSTAAL